MIQCSKCGLAVTEAMKFAIKSNLCPGCGTGLFSNKDLTLITKIQSRISTERFVTGLTQDTVYDIALFMFNEFKTGLGKSILVEMLAQQKNRLNPEEVEITDEIRKEIEEEFKEELERLTTSEYSEEDDFGPDNFDENPDIDMNPSEDYIDKVNRLKSQHQQRVKNGLVPKIGKHESRNPPVAVRRLKS